MPTAAKKPRGRPRKSAATSDPKPDVVTSDKKRTQTVARGRKRKAATAADKNQEEASPRRKNPRRSASKKKYKESDSDDEAYVNEDDQEDIKSEEKESNKKSATRRKTPKRAPARKKRSPKKEEEEEYKDEGEANGESGNEDDKSTTSAKSSKRRKSTSNRPGLSKKETFLQLKPGARCITKYGVVEVISDDQLPADHHKSKVTETEFKAARVVFRRMDKLKARKMELVNEFAVGSRHRREELQKIYLDSIAKNDDPTNDDNDKDTTQTKIWQQYCTTMTPKQILMDGKSWDKTNKPGKEIAFESLDEHDPRIPADFYPDRIVKCKLVKDERTVIDAKEPKKGAVHLQYIERDPIEDDVVQLPIILHLTRRELTRVYDPEELNHVCSFCGEGNFKSRVHVRYHIDQGFCTNRKLLAKEDGEKRIQSIENEALSGACSTETFLSKMHALPSIKANAVLFKKIEEFGNPCKIKPSKKDKMPPWIVFNSKRSPLYPEMYITLGFRRGSQNRNFYNKQKLDGDYVPKRDRRIASKRRKRFSLPGAKSTFKPSTHASRFSSVKVEIVQPSDQDIQPNVDDVNLSLPSLPPIDVTQNTLPVLPSTHASLPSLPSLPPIDITDTLASNFSPVTAERLTDTMDVDFGSNDNDSDMLDTGTTAPIAHKTIKKQSSSSTNRALPIEERETSVPYPDLGEGWIQRRVKRPNSSVVDTRYLSPDGWTFRSLVDARNFVDGKANKGQRARGRRKPSAVKISYQPPKSQDESNTGPPVVIDTQVLASECEAGRYPTITSFSGDHDDKCTLCHKPEEDDDAPLLECDFCKNSVHQVCLNKAMLRKEPPIVTRESEPHDSQLCHECLTTCLNRRARAETRRIKKWHYELQKAGLENIPAAAGLTEEVNLNIGDDNDDTQTNQKEDAPTYQACPTGGPGGLICCSYCNASYSRLLSNTAKEMEAQSIARKGQEVSEILELLADAKKRLLVATDLSRSNDERRSLLKNNEGAFSGGP